jgi:hypothetical protein
MRTTGHRVEQGFDRKVVVGVLRRSIARHGVEGPTSGSSDGVGVSGCESAVVADAVWFVIG